jgi:pimeloyl-ACP methyl ester carboxylesterase
LFRFFLGEARNLAINEIIDDSVKSDANTLNRAVSSMLRTDLKPELMRLKVPALIVHGGKDDIVAPNQIELFDTVSCAEVVLMPSSRHFPFLDEAELFNDVLLRFLKQAALPAMPVMSNLSRRETAPVPSHSAAAD